MDIKYNVHVCCYEQHCQTITNEHPCARYNILYFILIFYTATAAEASHSCSMECHKLLFACRRCCCSISQANCEHPPRAHNTQTHICCHLAKETMWVELCSNLYGALSYIVSSPGHLANQQILYESLIGGCSPSRMKINIHIMRVLPTTISLLSSVKQSQSIQYTRNYNL